MSTLDGLDPMPDPFPRGAGEEFIPGFREDDTIGIRPVPAAGDTAPMKRMSYWRQAVIGARFHYMRARREWQDARDRPGGRIAGLLDETWSVRAVLEYASRHDWVMPGHEGGLLEHSGDLWWRAMRPLIYWLGWVTWVHSRPLRWAEWTLIRFAVAMFSLWGAGDGNLALRITLITAGAIAGAAVILGPRKSEITVRAPAGTEGDGQEGDPEPEGPGREPDPDYDHLYRKGREAAA